jgi:hypothetical protein
MYAFALAESSASAGGARPPHVVVALSGCDPAMAGEVRRITALELRADVIAPAEVEDAVTRAEVVCGADLVELRVSDEATSKRLERAVSLSAAVPAARARLIALAVAELVAASWEESESNPEPRVPPLPPPRPESRAAVRRALRERPSAVIDAEANARWLAASAAWLVGGGMRVTFPLLGGLVLRVDAQADDGQVSRTLGDVALAMFGGSVGLGWALDGSSVSVIPWVGMDGGYARLVGLPGPGATGHVEQGGWTGPDVGVDLVFFARETVHATIGFAAAAAVVGVRGSVAGDRGADVLGLSATLTIGVGFSKR